MLFQLELVCLAEIQPLLKGNRRAKVDAVSTNSKAALPSADVLANLKDVCPNAVFFTVISKLGEEETDSASELTEDLPRTITSLGLQDSDKTAETVWETYTTSCSKEQLEYLEQSTRGQSVCPLWFEPRKGRITGTKAHSQGLC